MKTEKTKRLSLSEFVKKKHPEFKGKRVTQKFRAEYKKYLKDLKKKKKKDNKEFAQFKKEVESDMKKDKEFKDLKNFDKKMSTEDPEED